MLSSSLQFFFMFLFSYFSSTKNVLQSQLLTCFFLVSFKIHPSVPSRLEDQDHSYSSYLFFRAVASRFLTNFKTFPLAYWFHTATSYLVKNLSSQGSILRNIPLPINLMYIHNFHSTINFISTDSRVQTYVTWQLYPKFHSRSNPSYFQFQVRFISRTYP